MHPSIWTQWYTHMPSEVPNFASIVPSFHIPNCPFHITIGALWFKIVYGAYHTNDPSCKKAHIIKVHFNIKINISKFSCKLDYSFIQRSYCNCVCGGGGGRKLVATETSMCQPVCTFALLSSIEVGMWLLSYFSIWSLHGWLHILRLQIIKLISKNLQKKDACATKKRKKG